MKRICPECGGCGKVKITADPDCTNIKHIVKCRCCDGDGWVNIFDYQPQPYPYPWPIYPSYPTWQYTTSGGTIDGDH